MGKPRRSFVNGPFGQVHIRISEAESPNEHLPLVLLHQSPKSGREFLKLMIALSKTRTVIAIDNPGHGESDVPAAIDDATIENYAKSVWSVLDTLGYEKVDLFGNHTGSKVACEIACQNSERVRTIIMVSALVLSEEELQNFEAMFQPIPLDEAGTRFTKAWAAIVKHAKSYSDMTDMAASFAENFRAGEAYEWGHKAAFEYSRLFKDKVSSLNNRIIVFNPGDMLFHLTPRVAPLLQNGKVIDFPDWGFGFQDTFTNEAVAAIEAALNSPRL